VSFEPAFGPDRAALFEEAGPEFHLSRWIDVVRRRRLLLASVTGVVLVWFVLQYAITPKAYRAATIIQIERNAVNVLGGEMLGGEVWWDQEFFPTQYRLLQSRGIAERVVRNLRLADDPVFNPGHAALVSGSTSGGNAAGDEAALGGLASRLLGGLEINPIRNTRLVEIAYVAPNADLAARVANGVAEAYIDWGIESRYATVGKASTFLAQQIETLKQEIQDRESQLQAYSRRTDIVALDPSANVIMQRLESLNKDYIQAVSDRINKESRYQELEHSPEETAADTSTGGLVSQLRSEQLQLERDYATKLNVYKPDWPPMQELKARIDKGRQNLKAAISDAVAKARDEARTEYQTALRREQSLSDELERQKSDAMKLNSAAVEYNNLKLEVSTRRQLLDDLLKKQSETEVASRLQGTHESNVRVVDRALVPTAPFRPSLRRNLLLGLVLGLGFGLGAVVLVEYLDRTIKTPDDVERVLQIPVLSVIPDLSAGGRSGYGYGSYYRRHSSPRHKAVTRKGAPPADNDVELLPHVRPRHPVCEAYRALRTALLLSSAEGVRSVVVTSAIPSEGKTATAVNLAVVLAQLGKRVAIVDGDMRKPRLHSVFNVSNRQGLVNYLTGTVSSAAEVLQETSIEGLAVLPSGPIPPNPSELLGSERMRALIGTLLEGFEIIVFDTPPSLPVTDGTILGALVDGVVLCVGAGQIVREDARSGLERLRMAGVKVLGVALNRFRRQRSGYKREYHYYEGYYLADEAKAEDARTKAAADSQATRR
jgi:polysaccharide biosynthesis transport protein